MKIGLALGGGGARGFAHIGVLKVLEKNKIPIYQISGTSIGAVVGGAYAVFRDAQKVEAFMFDFINTDVFKELNLDVFDPDPEKSVSYWKQLIKTTQRNISLFKAWRYESMLSKAQVKKIFESYPEVEIKDRSLL